MGTFYNNLTSPYRVFGKVMDVGSNVASEVHGVKHWKQVAHIGHEIAADDPRVNLIVVFLFAMIHDAERLNEHEDPEHGYRAALLAKRLATEGFFRISEGNLADLLYAIRNHTHVKETPSPTIGACWDADRLTLPRVGKECDPEYLHHPYGKNEATRLLWANMVWEQPPSWGELHQMCIRLDEQRRRDG